MLLNVDEPFVHAVRLLVHQMSIKREHLPAAAVCRMLGASNGRGEEVECMWHQCGVQTPDGSLAWAKQHVNSLCLPKRRSNHGFK